MSFLPSSRPLPVADLWAIAIGLGLALLLVNFYFCGTSHRGPIQPASGARSVRDAPGNASLPVRLSETGLYEPGSTRRISARALGFTPQYPLWTDGASKQRWIMLPPGGAIDASDADRWQFPVGTRFFKEFRFGTRTETRLIEKLPDGSHRYATYLWDADGEDASLAPPGGVPAAKEVAPGVFHDIPAETDCRACHEGRKNPILGFNPLQLSWDRDPLAAHGEAPREDDVDLRELMARGLLRDYPAAWSETAPRIEAPSATARAAAGYLFGNCAGCHNGEGPLAELGLTFDQRVSDPQSYDRMRQSLLTETTHFFLPGAARSVRVALGSPENSAVAFRLRSRNPLTQMPPLGTQLVDQEGAALVERWIVGNLL